MMKTSPKGIALIKQFEGLRLTAYYCPAGVATIGYGTTKGVTADDVRNKRRITAAEAEAKLLEDLVEYERGVWQACTRMPNQHQYDAFVCFAFNIGVAGFKSSTVCKAHNRGDEMAASRAFGLWNKSTVNGKKIVLPGLVRRRAAEAALYLEPVASPLPFAQPEPMPQAVEPERPMTASTINRASVVAGGTATVAAVSETIQTINGVKYGVESLGNWLLPVLLVAVVGLCAYIVWERVKTRREGWA